MTTAQIGPCPRQIGLWTARLPVSHMPWVALQPPSTPLAHDSSPVRVVRAACWHLLFAKIATFQCLPKLGFCQNTGAGACYRVFGGTSGSLRSGIYGTTFPLARHGPRVQQKEPGTGAWSERDRRRRPPFFNWAEVPEHDAPSEPRHVNSVRPGAQQHRREPRLRPDCCFGAHFA